MLSSVASLADSSEKTGLILGQGKQKPVWNSGEFEINVVNWGEKQA